MEQKNNDVEAEKPAEASLQPSERNNEETENPVEASTKSQLLENARKAEDIAEASTRAQASKKRTPKSLKARSKVVKKSSPGTSFRAKKARKNRKEKNQVVLEGHEENEKNIKGKNKSVLESNQENGKNEDEDARNLNQKDKIKRNKGKEIQENQEKFGRSSKSEQDQRTEEKYGGLDGSNQKNKKRHVRMENSQQDEKKKEKLGGLIFMCSAKTKPDCLHYRVMGVTLNRKDLVLSVKPGLKLFLYDFDLKLMYGIYEASSSGGMRLEPKAFGGSFPVQVRFRVHKDCFPLPENVFRKAIKDNYNGRNKFDIELTVQQVRNLSKLFRPAPAVLKSPAVPVRPAPLATIRDREVYEGVRESRPASDKEAFARAGGDGRRYPVLSHERNQRDEFARDLFISEKEYRTYGLQGDRRNLAPQLDIASTQDPYQRDLGREHLLRQPDPYQTQRDLEREHLLRQPDPYQNQRDLEREHLPRQPAPTYGGVVPVHGEYVFVDPLYSTRREFKTYNISGSGGLPPAVPSVIATASGSSITALDSSARDPYYPYRPDALSVDAYLPPPRREEASLGSYYVDGRRESYLPESDLLRRRETGQSVGAPSNNSQIYSYHGAQPESAAAPVSSRYSFAGPSVSYR